MNKNLERNSIIKLIVFLSVNTILSRPLTYALGKFLTTVPNPSNSFIPSDEKLLGIWILYLIVSDFVILLVILSKLREKTRKTFY